MYFYEVLVSSPRFHGFEPLTYQSEQSLEVGAVVVVELRAEAVVGIVLKSVSTPSFKTKSIVKRIINTPIPTELLKLLDWLRSYYPAPLGNFAQLVLPSSLLRQKELASISPVRPDQKQIALPPLIPEQQAVVDAINKRTDTATAILHGDTGTGKTRVYLELARQSLDAGKSVLMLTPEIGLTPQFKERLRSSLPYPVITMHSQLTPAERRTAWLQVLQASEPIVVLGPRSALFTPIKRLGLIVVDEAHDAAYKQEQAPHYQAVRVASRLAALHAAQLIIGTATPSVTDYFMAEQTGAPIHRLTIHPAGTQSDKQITVVNLRERDQFPSQPHLSKPLIEQINVALQNKQQSLVFLNRRGTARLVLCQVCGWQATCPRCDLPLTYHGDSHNLRCHTCGHTEPSPSSCPECKSTDIIFKSVGTKSIADELHKVFPDAKIKRFDTDNLKEDRLEQHYDSINDGRVDILVGTQILAKGLDLPNLSVVGVVVADTSLYFPDYTAEEQTFQLLTQVMGRVGRGHSHGNIVIQTYNPDSPAIQAAVKQDWHDFYVNQLAERKAFGFPPYYHLLKLSCTRASRNSAETASKRLVKELQSSGLRIAIIGPTPSFYEKTAGKYRWQILVKAKDRRQLLKAIGLLPSGWSYDIDPANLL